MKSPGVSGIGMRTGKKSTDMIGLYRTIGTVLFVQIGASRIIQ